MNSLQRALSWGFATLGVVALLGCGGDVRPRTSTITGSVVDVDFNPMRGAEVRCEGEVTNATTSGSYALQQVPNGDVEVTAEAHVNGTRYFGRTTVFNLEDTQQNNVNIVVAPDSQRGTITGTVRDREGFTLMNASVFVYSGAGSSQRAVTNEDGQYTLRDVPANIQFTISASGRGYRSDQDVIVISGNQTRVLDFVLSNPGLPALSPPSNIGAVTWVTPPPTRSQDAAAYEFIKKLYDKRHKTTQVVGRAIRSDMSVETELFWDLMQFPDLLGFNIYRGNGATGSVSAIDLSFDPLANYYLDVGINPFSTYSYAISTVSTLYPDYGNTESQLSNRIVVDTLSRLDLNGVTAGPTIRWRSGSGADEFIVYVFEDFPTGYAGSADQAYADNANNPTTGLSWTYNGPPLEPGRTYYYVVLGLANGFDSRTISEIGTFVP